MKSRLMTLLLLALSVVPAMAQQALPPPRQATAPNANSNPAAVPPAQAQIQKAFPPTAYGAQNYAVPAQATQNGVAPIPPLEPPTNTNYQQAEDKLTPFSREEIIRLRKELELARQAKAYRPVRSVPKISSSSVDLSPGAALPIVRTMAGETSTLVFVDSTGAPWPLAAAPRVSDKRSFAVEWLENTPSVVISPLSGYEEGNVTCFLEGLPTPVVVKLSTAEPDAKAKTRTVDYRLDLRIPGRGPNAQAALLGPDKVALYDNTLQSFLDGLPPADAKALNARGELPPRTQIWQYGGALFVRTSADIQSAFDQSMSAGDGTKVYRLGLTPYVTLSDLGESVTLELDIN